VAISSKQNWRMLAITVILPVIALSGLWLFRLPTMSQKMVPLPFKTVLIDKTAIGIVGIGDVNMDGFKDIVVRGEPEKGNSELVWYEYPDWSRHIIAKYINFRSDAFGLADVDGDHDLDVVVVIDEPGNIYWFANPGQKSLESEWSQKTLIGITDAGPPPDSYVKDLCIADFNRDGQLDVVARTHRKVFLFYQKSPSYWIASRGISIHPHEGMDIGDLDGDGDVDIVLNGFWLENPVGRSDQQWHEHPIDPRWWQQNTAEWTDNNSKVKVADLNQDGRLDVILSHSEKPGYPVIWYENADVGQNRWVAHTVADTYDYCHTLLAEDIDLDGDQDVIAARMPRNSHPGELAVFLNAGDSAHWSKTIIAQAGTYSAKAGDIGNDGDMDIVGGRSWDQPPVILWENEINDRLRRWTYIQVDDRRGKWGDAGTPKWLRFFGLAAADLTHDNYLDIASGRYFYRNPGGDLAGTWQRVDFGRNMDAVLMVDVDGDEFGDIIAQALPDIFWLEAADIQGLSWDFHKIAQIPVTEHGNAQGYASGQIVSGGRPEVILAGGNGEIYYLEIPDDPTNGFWPKTLITKDSNTEGIAIGDVDGDGNIDIAAANRSGDQRIAWWKNPGPSRNQWIKFPLGTTDKPNPDRFALADLNGDLRPDIVVTEETELDGAKTYWFEQPLSATKGPWPRHIIVEQYTTNSLDTADMDGDGDIDIITGEHRGTRKVAIWENVKGGRYWIEHVVDSGRESHLGTRVFDMDSDGDYDIVSIAWDDYKYLHLWRNDNVRR
jgi:hypothetical protein